MIHASNNLSMDLMGNNFKGILEVTAYKASLPKSAKVGTRIIWDKFLDARANFFRTILVLALISSR